MHPLRLLAALIIGIALGMSWQWRRNSKRINALEREAVDLRGQVLAPMFAAGDVDTLTLTMEYWKERALAAEARIEYWKERTAAAEIGHLQTAVAIAWDFLNDDDWGEQDGDRCT